MIDFTEGPCLKKIILFSLPLLIGNMFQQLYTVVDSILLGRFVSDTALAAAGTVIPINFLMLAIISGFTLGTSLVTAMMVGEKNKKQISRLVESTFLINMSIGIMLAAISFLFARPLVVFMKTPSSVIDQAVLYLRIISVGLIFQCLNQYMTDVLRGLGDSKTPLYFLIISTVLNIVLDLFFIMALSMGIAGVAYATLIAQIVSAVTCVVYTVRKYEYFRISAQLFHIDTELLFRSLRMGLPSAMQQTVGSLGAIGIQSVVNGFGEVGMNAYNSAYKIDNFMMLPLANMGVALGVYVAQNVGAKKPDRVESGFRTTSAACLVISLFFSTIIFGFSEPLVQIFTASKETITEGGWGLRVLAVPFFLCGQLNLFTSLFKGMGRVNVAFGMSLFQVVLRLAVCFGFSGISAIGLNAVWFSMPLTWILMDIFSYWYYRKYIKIKNLEAGS